MTESSSSPQPGETALENHEEKEFLRASTIKEFPLPGMSRVEPIPRQDEVATVTIKTPRIFSILRTRKDVVELAKIALIILSIVSIMGLAIAYQYYYIKPAPEEAAMSELSSKLKNTETELQTANKCTWEHLCNICCD